MHQVILLVRLDG